MDFDKLLVENVAKANKSSFGQFLSGISTKVGGPSVAALLNVLCTASLGIIISYPLFLLGGLWIAHPPIILTLSVLSIILASIASYRLGIGKKPMRHLLALAIFFSLPFGLLSLPLLHAISIGNHVPPANHNK